MRLDAREQWQAGGSVSLTMPAKAAKADAPKEAPKAAPVKEVTAASKKAVRASPGCLVLRVAPAPASGCPAAEGLPLPAGRDPAGWIRTVKSPQSRCYSGLVGGRALGDARSWIRVGGLRVRGLRLISLRRSRPLVSPPEQKKNAESINSRLALVMKSGKYMLGYKSTLKSLRKGVSKLVIIANNCPPLRKSEIEYYAMLAKTGVHHYTYVAHTRTRTQTPDTRVLLYGGWARSGWVLHFGSRDYSCIGTTDPFRENVA